MIFHLVLIYAVICFEGIDESLIAVSWNYPGLSSDQECLIELMSSDTSILDGAYRHNNHLVGQVKAEYKSFWL